MHNIVDTRGDKYIYIYIYIYIWRNCVEASSLSADYKDSSNKCFRRTRSKWRRLRCTTDAHGSTAAHRLQSKQYRCRRRDILSRPRFWYARTAGRRQKIVKWLCYYDVVVVLYVYRLVVVGSRMRCECECLMFAEVFADVFAMRVANAMCVVCSVAVLQYRKILFCTFCTIWHIWWKI